MAFCVNCKQVYLDAESGGTPNPDSEVVSYRWERRWYDPANRYLYYVLRKGRNGSEKVVCKYLDPNSAEDTVSALNAQAPMEVL